jgi:hypothetical protein
VYLLGLAAAVLLLAVGFVLQQHAAEPKGNGNEVIDNLTQARGNQNGCGGKHRKLLPPADYQSAPGGTRWISTVVVVLRRSAHTG